MNRAEMLREVRMERFEEVYELWRGRRTTQAWAASVLGVTDRTFRRWVVRSKRAVRWPWRTSG